MNHAARLPHPIPYQGSKRLLAERILGVVGVRKFGVLYEPFVGSGAITIAAASRRLAERYEVSDTLGPLVGIWRSIIDQPLDLANAYRLVWEAQFESDSIGHFNLVRSEFNEHRDPVKLLYLLARCVKNAPRFNGDGAFNQSPDKRRNGMQPAKMRRQVEGVSALLKGHANARALQFEDALKDATDADLVYLDPPWEGTSTGRDRRYHEGLDRERLIAALDNLNRRGVPVLLSYDGRCGEKTYGLPLPGGLGLVHLELHAGRSSQATLLGRVDETVESLYVTESLLGGPRLGADVFVEQLALIDTAAA